MTCNGFREYARVRTVKAITWTNVTLKTFMEDSVRERIVAGTTTSKMLLLRTKDTSQMEDGWSRIEGAEILMSTKVGS